MKNQISLLLIFFILALCASAQLPKNKRKYKLVFNDEFDRVYPKTGIDTKRWNRTMPWNQTSNLTPDLNWCGKDSGGTYWDRAYVVRDYLDTTTMQVKNGTCKIITNKGPFKGRVTNWPPCDPEKPGYAIGGSKCQDECSVRDIDSQMRCRTNDTLDFKYSTGMLFSYEKFKYGFFELRFRLPENPKPPATYEGFGPNFWLWGNAPPTNYQSEIDIFEIIAFYPAKQDSNKYTSTVHYSEKNVPHYPSAHSEAIGNMLYGDTNWHVAAAWWTADFVKFYIDDSLYFTVETSPRIPFDKYTPMSIIIDVNSPTSGRCNDFDPAHTQFPYVYEIDYVRVYQEK